MADGSIIIDTKIDGSGAEKGIGSLGKLGSMAGNALGVATKAAAGMAVGITAATGAVVALTKASVEQYAQYEQLTGGVETLFNKTELSLEDFAAKQGKTTQEAFAEWGELTAGSRIVFNNAEQAYKTAGLSANAYMETITGFSASLLQGLGGDTKKAADIGNMAVVDMSDNANKMGTAMESIQNAYQGFAKQNYTMLDNLKLGYGGTKSEMERLLTDAEKISGVHYDISNFSDIISAIHTIQEQMGITGTTTKEAMSTIEGSLNMTKAAWTNMLTGMADDNADFDTLVNNLVESLSALGENLMPRIGIALNGVGQLIDTLLPIVIDKIPEIISSILPGMVEAGTNIIASLGNAIMQSLPTVINYGVQLIQNLLNGIQQSLPSIANCVVQVLSSLTNGLLEVLPQVLSIGMQAIAYLAQGIAQQLPTLIPLAVQCIMQLLQNFYDNMPLVIEAGMQLLSGLAEGIINAIPVLIEMLPQVIDSMLNYVTTSLPLILEQGCNILLTLADGIVQALPQLVAMLPQIINTIVTGLLGNLPQIIQAGIQIIVALASGLLQAKVQLIGAIPTIVSSIFSAFTSVNWGEIGINIIKGIGSGILNGVTGLVGTAIEACKSLTDKVKDFFGIHSPSHLMRDEVGVMLIKGIEVGMEQESDNLINTATNICTQLTNQFGNILNEQSAEDMVNRFKSVTGVLGTLTNELNNAQSRVNWANGLTLDDNKWYYDAKTRLEDVKYQLEELSDQISDTEDKNTKKSLQEQQKSLQKKQKLIQKEFDYYKEAAQNEINERKEATKKELEIAKEKYSRLEDLSKALTAAIKEQLNQQKDAAISSIESEMDKAEKAYNKACDLIDKQTDRKKSSIQKKIDALDEEKEAESRLQEIQESNNNIAILQAKLNNTASEADKKALELKIKNSKAALEQKKKEWDREDEKAALKEQQDELEEKAKKKKDNLKADYEAIKENYENQKKAAEDYYNKLLETDSINAQARYMILTRSNDELVQLLQAYNPLWQDAGQSLADSLINGLNSKKQDMASAVAEMTSFRNGISIDGYETGTTYNRIAGAYTVDEKGFELSTNNNPVAYVSKGAGILNHMQSLDYINKVISEKVGTLGNKLKSAVMAEQYKMGQLAMATTTNSYGGNVDNSSNDLNLTIENFNNNNNSDIESLARELQFYKDKKKR
ncbi:phage tail tape measure protein [Clostridium butyricum]|uniref:phage tail tape measure protein n=1 Tax=Clostridium butyricum TaxID=1492 RepID=UPI002AB0B036|nr:phage tail tape measure protein [Clostridium butyricum]